MTVVRVYRERGSWGLQIAEVNCKLQEHGR